MKQRVSSGETVREVELVEGRGHAGQKSWILKLRGIDTVDQVSFSLAIFFLRCLCANLYSHSLLLVCVLLVLNTYSGVFGWHCLEDSWWNFAICLKWGIDTILSLLLRKISKNQFGSVRLLNFTLSLPSIYLFKTVGSYLLWLKKFMG